MGAEFIFSVISSLSSLLSSLRSSGATLVDKEGNEIESDLDRLERLLRRIRAALRDASKREIREEYVKLWLIEVKTVAYEAEDILDECQYELLRRKIEESGQAGSSSAGGKKRKWLDGVISDEMAERIKGVIERFEEISRDKDALSLKEDDGERRGFVWTSMLPTSHLVNESAIFGRDEDKQKILDFALSDGTGTRYSTSVLAIVGMGGVGKTTLAQLVYNDSLIQNHFDLRAWVYVSPNFNVLQITKDILEAINPQAAYGGLTALSVAQKALVEAVKEQKIFIVLDDVWNESPRDWEQFVEPLHAAELVKIVMTTRNEDVAQKSGITDVHNLSCLSENQSGSLFEHYVYGGEFVDADSCLKRIGVQIIKKCAGLPLAIKSIGRVLSYKMDEDSWRYILESELWESDGKDEIFPALKVSYYSLPLELKLCFLFCSLFPKGSKFKMNEIIYMWIAHGYVRPCGGRSAEDIGKYLVHDLCRRSFLTKVYTQKRSGLEYYRMHDLIHDLARSISMGEIYTIDHADSNDAYAGIYHAYTEEHGMIGGSSRSCLLMRTLHTEFEKKHTEVLLALLSSVCLIPLLGNLLGYNSMILALLRFMSKFKITDPNHNMDIMGCYNPTILENINLRVLKWEGACAHHLVNIGKLKHLRYLELNNKVLRHVKVQCDKLQRLPESITLLCNIVALKISFLEDLEELPVNFGKLINLRSLDIIQLGIRDLPEPLGHLGNLQYLSVSSCEYLQNFPSSIGNLTSLKELYISNLNIQELPESFCMFQSLQTLSIYGCPSVTQIPSGIGDLTNLRRIYYSGVGIETLPESMNRLCNLKILELSCSISPVALLCGFERLLSRSSLNFSINRLDGKKQESWQSKEDCCKYVKTQRLMESLQPVSDLVKLEINGYEGIGYAFSQSSSLSAAIAMHCHIKCGYFFSELGELPSLKSLSLVMITGVQNLQLNNSQLRIRDTSKVRFPFLEKMELVNMPEWSGVVGERDGDFPVLEFLKIENCPKLSSIPNFGNNLRRLEIITCSFPKLELNLLQLQLLESLYIEECLQLTLLEGLQSLNSIRTLYVLRCPLLKEFLYPVMPKLPLSIDIVACPFLEGWCQIRQLNFIKDFFCKTLVTSGNWDIMKQLYQNIFVEHLVVRNYIKKSLTLDECLLNLRTVEVRNCWNLETFEGLHILRFIRKLVLWDCPQLQQKKPGGEGNIPLPPKLQSLAVHGCHKFLSLDLLAQDQSSLTELEVTDCRLLMCIVGLQDLTNLETLAIIQCQRLLLEPLHVVPECVVISGCPRLKGWCEMHSVEPLDDDTDYNTCEGFEVELKGRLTLD